jgi:CspA family cold shock protein
MESGVCKFFNTEKGFGFIAPDLGGKDVFVHVYELQDDLGALSPGDRVEYDIGHDERSGKMKAVKVRLLA